MQFYFVLQVFSRILIIHTADLRMNKAEHLSLELELQNTGRLFIFHLPFGLFSPKRWLLFFSFLVVKQGVDKELIKCIFLSSTCIELNFLINAFGCWNVCFLWWHSSVKYYLSFILLKLYFITWCRWLIVTVMCLNSVLKQFFPCY